MHAQSLLLHKLSGTVSEVAGSFIAFGWPGGGGGGGGGVQLPYRIGRESSKIATTELASRFPFWRISDNVCCSSTPVLSQQYNLLTISAKRHRFWPQQNNNNNKVHAFLV